MGSWIRLFGLTVFVAILSTVGIYIFTRGFLLKRLVVDKNSTCVSDFHYKTPGAETSGCWLDRSYSKAVIIIIDALRYDFVVQNSSSAADIPYQNQLQYLNNLLRIKPMNARVMKFIADPPTTTMQRLKGLTTGGLPTFIDAGENFASSEIHEDNIIDQLIKLKKKITFMGDDTWLGLYPNKFHKSFPFPSFNVMDLHTVDDGIIKHLVPQLVRRDWDLLIAHFLGVDHCGHRYGPNHVEMSKKLKQMDAMIRNVTRQLKEDTILFIMGDHGMTQTGDHGGDSHNEVEAGLFIYSPSPITSNPPPKTPVAVSQIDLVPTLSLLLGAPIPHSNIGSVITDLFSHSPVRKSTSNRVQNVYYSVEALHLNAHQVLQYLTDYNKLSNDIPPADVLQLTDRFTKIESRLSGLINKIYYDGDDSTILHSFSRIRDDLKSLLDDAKNLCQRVWTRFNMFSMVLGICAVEVVIFILIELISKPSVTRTVLVLGSVVLSFMCLLYLIQESEAMKIVLGTGLAVLAIVICVCKTLSKTDEPRLTMTFNKLEIFSLICYSVQLGSLFSNSLVVHEDVVLTFLIISLTMAHLVKIKAMKSSNKKKSDFIYYLTSPNALFMIMTLLICVGVRMTSLFHACREEQFCESSSLLKPLSAIMADKNSERNIRFIISTLTTLALPVFYHRIVKKDGNLNGHSAIVVCQTYSPKILAGCTVLYWAQQALPADTLTTIPAWQRRILPLTAYSCLLVSALVALLEPVSVYIRYRDGGAITGDGNVIAKIFNHIKTSYGDNKPPLVYGLGTVYSSHLMFVTLLLIQLVAMLHSDGLAPVFLVMVLCMGLVLEVRSYNRDRVQIESPPLSSLILWFMMSSKFFYATGHQATIPSIQWQSAFVGFEGDHATNIVPAILVVTNTFSSQLIFALSLPLMVVWPYARGKLVNYFTPSDVAVADERGEYMLYENQANFLSVTRHTILVYHALSVTKLLCTMLCALVLRRHLMVWKIFAPRFIFEGISFLMTSLSLCVTSLIMIRMNNRLDAWTREIIRINKSS